MTRALKFTKENGEFYYSVPQAARILGMRTAGVRYLMGQGVLEWNQTRLNGRLIVRAESVAAYLRSSAGRSR